MPTEESQSPAGRGSVSGTAAQPPSPAPMDAEPPPVDLTSPQFTLRAVLTGMVLGGALSICNVYMGLRVGFSINMSITGALLGYALWAGVRGIGGSAVRPWGILENNISQTACSAAATVASAGLVAPIPALALLTGQTLSWPQLSVWMASVMLVGIVAAIPLRRQMILVEKLPFASGMATAAMLQEMYAAGAAAVRRVVTFLAGAAVAGATMLVVTIKQITPYALPFSIKGISAKALTIAVEPSLFYVGIGGLIGFRACCSLLIGALVAYGVLSPALVEHGVVAQAHYGALNAWLRWPGAVLIVVGSLVSAGFSWRSMAAAFRLWGRANDDGTPLPSAHDVPRSWFLPGLIGVLLLSVVLQVALFKIMWWMAAIGVLLSFLFAVVAARVSGETALSSTGALGKATQFIFGGLAPHSPVPNLMAANVTAGAASQCADLMDDLKCGHLLGASPRWQTLAQTCGALAGALIGSAAYLILIPHPAEMLGKPPWPAPGVAPWKAVAELFQDGFGKLPTGVPLAMAIAAAAGTVLAVIERTVPRRVRPFMLSPVSLGLAFVCPAHVATTIFIGGLLALVLRRWLKDWTSRYLVVTCAGLIVGETLAGMGVSLYHALAG